MNHEPRTTNQRGFTFVEIMIVLVIIGILLTLAQPSFSTSVQRAREAALKENLFIMREVLDQHYADHGEYPPSLEALVEKRYLRRIPKDPITGSEATWVLIQDQNEDGTEAGIFDIKSSSEQVGMDGTAHNTW
jgi:general secretion pathway protein G